MTTHSKMTNGNKNRNVYLSNGQHRRVVVVRFRNHQKRIISYLFSRHVKSYYRQLFYCLKTHNTKRNIIRKCEKQKTCLFTPHTSIQILNCSHCFQIWKSWICF